MLAPITGWVLFLLLVWLPVEAAVSAFCFNNYDLGIYAQALALLSPGDLNPFLSTRDVRIFNDHFDPILLVVAPLRQFIRPELLAIRADMVAVLAASLAPLWLAKHRLVPRVDSFLGFLLILFSPLSLSALYYPAHPGTWALAPLAWVFAFLWARRDGLAIAMLAVLMACKEEFPAIGLVMGAVLWCCGRRQQGAWFMLLSAIWGFVVFALRPIMLGKSDFYTSAVLGGSGLAGIGTDGAFKQMVFSVLAAIGPWFLLRWRLVLPAIRNLQRTEIALPLGVLAALLVIRLLGGYWGNHRGAPLAIASAFLVMGSGIEKPASRRRLFFFGLFLVATSFPHLELGSRLYRFKPFKKHCPASGERIAAINQAIDFLEEHNARKVLASGNLVPRLAAVPGVAQIGATAGSGFRYLLLEKKPSRNTWPVGSQDYEKIESDWRSKAPKTRAIIDNNHVVLLEQVE